MPRRPIYDWLPYLDAVLALWTEFGEDFKVGDLTLTGARELRTDLQTTLDRLNTLQAELGLTMGERDQEISDIESFAVKFRSAVIAQYGPDYTQAARVPKVDPPRGRGGGGAPQPPTV